MLLGFRLPIDTVVVIIPVEVPAKSEEHLDSVSRVHDPSSSALCAASSLSAASSCQPVHRVLLLALGHRRCMGSLDECLFGVFRLKMVLKLLHALADSLADRALHMRAWDVQ
jgi:hypothetical protein